jgi:hypothetical protein
MYKDIYSSMKQGVGSGAFDMSLECPRDFSGCLHKRHRADSVGKQCRTDGVQQTPVVIYAVLVE